MSDVSSPVSILFDVSGSAFGSSTNPIGVTCYPKYQSTTGSLTVTIASLADSSARASTSVSNTTTVFDDVMFMVKVKTAAAATSATGYVNIYGYAGISGSTFAEGISGSDGAVTLSSPPNVQLLAQITANANSTTYTAGPFSFCKTYGLSTMPPVWGLVVQNKTGATLDATAGSHAIWWQGVNRA